MLRNYVRAKFAEIRYRGLKRHDPWFFSHYVTAANRVGRHLARVGDLRSASVLDFGCGDGYMALGLLRFNPQAVVGVDLNPAYQHLPKTAGPYLGMNELPRKLEFQQVREGEALPFEHETFEAVYAWSVFEHVSDLNQVLQELHRVLKPEGILYIQIEPLFHSPFGSHLRRLIPEPWAHLMMAEEDFLERAGRSKDHVHPKEQDVAYQTLDFTTYRQFLINEYRSLNRVTLQELEDITQTYFKVVQQDRIRAYPYSPPPELLARYRQLDLLTNEVHITLKK